MNKVTIILSKSRKHIVFFGEKSFVSGLEESTQFDAREIEEGADADAVLQYATKQKWEFINNRIVQV